MQLINSQTTITQKSAGNVALLLAAASMNLVSSGSYAKETPWQVDSSLLIYSESDSRVSAIEPIVALKKDMGDEHFFSLKMTLDSLTGASPNGAVASNSPQTFTGPSGKNSYTADAGETPLDDSFKDTRAALNVNWEQPWGERNRISIGGNFSKEYDFTSLGLNAAIARDFNSKNTTLSLGIGYEADQINPVGGTPLELSAMVYGEENKDLKQTRSDESKDVMDLLFGVTQVMNRHWVTQLNYSYGSSSGYHTDPYKILSVLDDQGNLVNHPSAEINNWYAYESRPDSRTRHSLYWANKIHLTEDVIDFSYRYYTDDWGIDSHTLDLRYRYQFAGNMYLEPHLRWYQQTAADFYNLYLLQSQQVTGSSVNLDYASADPRLAELTGTSFGLKYGIEFSPTSEFNIRVEQYTQSYDLNRSTLPALSGLDLAPDLTAMTISFGYSFEF
jgi:Protein of unknown function (DUF3570)